MGARGVSGGVCAGAGIDVPSVREKFTGVRVRGWYLPTAMAASRQTVSVGGQGEKQDRNEGRRLAIVPRVNRRLQELSGAAELRTTKALRTSQMVEAAGRTMPRLPTRV